MNDETFDRIADAVLDGTAGVDERRELERLLRDEPGARDRFQALRSTFESLRDLPRPEPPGDLRASILAAVRAEGAPTRSWQQRVWRSLVGGPRLRFAYAFGGFAVGAFATLVFTGALVRGAHEGWPVAGTMAGSTEPRALPSVEPPPLAVVDESRLEWAGVSLSAETLRDGQRLALRLEGRAGAPARVQVTFDPRELRLNGTAWPGTEGSLELADGRATLVARGAISARMEWNTLARDLAPIRIEVTVGGASRTLQLDVRPEPPGTRP